MQLHYVGIDFVDIYYCRVELTLLVWVVITYMPDEGPNVAKIARSRVVFDRKWKGSHSLFCCYFDRYQRVMINLCSNEYFFHLLN